jgi:DNA-binding Xre family transcriptional regulator
LVNNQTGGSEPMNETQQWIDTLKRCLRTRGLTYRDVAAGLELSEASVKRLFSYKTCSLSRLEQICRMMDMSFSDLARLNDRQYSERQTTLSLEQEQALAADAILLSYFYLLLNGWTGERIAKRFALEEHRQIRLLASLDRLGLIELQPENRVRLLTARRIQWRRDGPVRRLYEREVKLAFLHDAFADTTAHFGFESAELAPESARLIRRRLARITREFDEMAELDVNLEPNEKRGYGLMVALRPWAYWNIVLNDNEAFSPDGPPGGTAGRQRPRA